MVGNATMFASRRAITTPLRSSNLPTQIRPATKLQSLILAQVRTQLQCRNHFSTIRSTNAFRTPPQHSRALQIRCNSTLLPRPKNIVLRYIYKLSAYLGIFVIVSVFQQRAAKTSVDCNSVRFALTEDECRVRGRLGSGPFIAGIYAVAWLMQACEYISL